LLTRKNKDQGSEPPVDANARIQVSDEDKAKAEKWFVRARELGEKRQFDYAVEYYVNGLEFWPEAVEEACKPLHGCAVARKQGGGKKPGLKDTMRRSMSDKDPKQAYVNALWLFGHDPDNVGYSEGVVKNASRLRAEDAAKWAAGVCHKALEANPKTSAKQFQSLIQQLEELGDRAAARGEAAFGVECFQLGVGVLRSWARKFPKDESVDNALRALSTKLTILKGQYEKGDSFRDSIADTESQKDLHDRDRSVQSEERMDQLIAKAQKDYEENPDVATKLKTLVELLCRREHYDDEAKAIGFLVNEFKRTDDYRWKLMADDIRMKQLGREVREAAKSGDAEAVKKKRVEQLRFELGVFKDRVQRYPTDLRLKYELAVRNFKAGRIDDAIPLFQNARSDPKNRVPCAMYMGRCFFKKGYFSQAISMLEDAISQYEIRDDELAKDLRYWLGRSQEASDEQASAAKTYGELLQLDYNYRDVRKRLDELNAGK
jgi:TolA-binding protein